MASVTDLFGGGNKRPKAPKWDSVGETHVGVLTDEPTLEQETDFTTRQPKWMVKQGDKWGPLLEGQFDKDTHEHFAVQQIVCPVILQETGEPATFYFSGEKSKKLKEAMTLDGIELVPGTTIGIRYLGSERTTKGGNKKKWDVKLAAPAE